WPYRAACRREEALRHRLMEDRLEHRAQRLGARRQGGNAIARFGIALDPGFDLAAQACIELAVEIGDQGLVIRLLHRSYSFACGLRPRVWPGAPPAPVPAGS